MTLTLFPAGQAADDARLVARRPAGDEGAFARLYERYARVIHGVLLARAPRADVEDLVQDVFLTAWRRLDDLRDPAAFGGWLAMIARNRATDFHRRTVESVELPDDLVAHDGDGGATPKRSRSWKPSARCRTPTARRWCCASWKG